MTNVLTDPDRFFSELSERVVMIIGTIMRRFPDDLAQSVNATAAPTIKELISGFAFWFVVAGVFYAISALFKGNGSFNQCLEFTGYGFIPAIVASVIALAVIRVVPLTVEFPVESPELMAQTLMQNPLMKTAVYT